MFGRDLPEHLSTLPRDVQYLVLADAIGHTPIVDVPELGNPSIKQQLEFCNLSGSHYIRAYLPTLQHLESEGLIRPGDELRDISSGSAGISLALLGKQLGFGVRITVPDELPSARTKPMEDYGAAVVHCGKGYIRAASAFQATEIIDLMRDGWKRQRAINPDMRAITLEKDGRRICYVNHTENLLTVQAFRNIGNELVSHFGTSMPPGAVALAMGNFTTIAGISEVVRETWPKTKIIGYEGENTDNHDNYGTTVHGVKVRFKDLSLLDATTVVSNDERDKMNDLVNSRRRAELQVGHSSLMGLCVAKALAKDTDGHIVCIAYDQLSRY